MNVITLICHHDEPLVKTLPTDTGLVSSNQEYGPAPGIEGERDPPDTAVGVETQLFHIAVL